MLYLMFIDILLCYCLVLFMTKTWQWLWRPDSKPNKLSDSMAVQGRGSAHSIHPSAPLQSSLQTHYLAWLPKCIPNNPYKSYNLGQVNVSPLFSLFSSYFHRSIIQRSSHHSVRSFESHHRLEWPSLETTEGSWSNPSSGALDFNVSTVWTKLWVASSLQTALALSYFPKLSPNCHKPV